MTLEFNYLPISWSISRGRDTYGYNICRLDSRATGKRYRCNGGGYDMVGTVLGEWLSTEHQERLQILKAHNVEKLESCGYAVDGWMKIPGFYGLTFDIMGKARIDGACGVSSVSKIAEACGLNVTSDYSTRARRSIGFFVNR